jgi:hypothetical protein
MRFKAGYTVLLIAITIALCTSCKKVKTLTNGGRLTFSVDTLMFDTVFTASGSFTQSFKIFNPQAEDVIISSIRLANGTSTYFHLNVDGFKGNTQSNLKIRAHDSIYVFATVNIDPNNAQSPFIISDNFIATMNGQNFNVPFTAFGQNAHYIVDSVLEGNVTWDKTLPYVILHNAAVDFGAILTINAGTRIYVNQDSRLYVFGKLNVMGTATDSVIFQGDRLDRAYFGYQGYPGEWGGLYFDSAGRGSQMHYTILKNCGGATTLNGRAVTAAAIEVYKNTLLDPSPAELQLTMDHCIIENSVGYGMFCLGGCLHMDNCRINTCGAQALAIVQGGYDTVENCTFACFGTDKVAHTDNSTVLVVNYIPNDDNTYSPGNLNSVLRNCIIWGGLSTEFQCDSLVGGTFNFVMENCLYRADSIEKFAQPKLRNCIANMDPMFKNSNNFDFHIPTMSPAYQKGITWPYTNNTDLDGNPWGSPYDIGCYKAK